jgi:hypothetical protein
MRTLILPTFLAAILGLRPAVAQITVFDQDFDGGYSGAFGTDSYSGGNPQNASNAVETSGGNPNGCWTETITPTNNSTYYTGQLELMEVAGMVDPNAADYVISFDAYGNRAGTIQFIVQTWPDEYYGGTGPVINASTNLTLTGSNTWQTFRVNLGNLTTANPIAATWQLEFQISSWLWGGANLTDTLKIDNLKLVQSANVSLVASENPSAYGAGVSFTFTVQTNHVAAGNATGRVVFSAAGRPFSTNTVSGGAATSALILNLPIGTDAITAVYSGGNYSASTNTAYQIVEPPSGLAGAEDNLPLYTDNLVNGFQSWSWATVDLAVNSPVHSGSYAISVTDGGSQALSLEHPQFNTGPYASLSFWANGGSAGGQKLQITGLVNDNSQSTYKISTPLPTNTWRQFTIPLAQLGVSNVSECTGFWIQGSTGSAQPTFFVDDIQLVATAVPTVVHLGVDAGKGLQIVDARQFGLNTATWDGSLGGAETLPQLEQIGCRALRWPGGSTSDAYDWASDAAGNATFRQVATNLGATVFTTVNYGTGTPAEAVAWVLDANQTNHCGFKYWEIGNECYGTWETDSNSVPHDPYTYATRAAAYFQQMKAAYTNLPIKVGVVAVPGEDTFINNTNHAVVNPRTHATHYGWTPVMLTYLKSLGVTPDFLIYHFYWQYTTAGWTYYSGSPDSDALLLQVAGNSSPTAWSDWASAAASLRQQLNDYLGTNSTNVELCVTENNSDSGAMGRESTSLVNALYLADSTSQLQKTEFRSYLWWDLHNGSETDGDFDPTIYGWRSSGDYGIMDSSDTPYPTFYAEKLLQHFARPGDSVLNGTSDNPRLSAYAVRRTNGALTLLVINKSMVNTLNAQIGLTNFVPWTEATTLSYGIAQDEAAATNATAALQDLATNSFAVPGAGFTYAFPPLSLTLFTFAPAPAVLTASHSSNGQLQLLLQGQPGTPYILQSSPDLASWAPLATNTLTTSSATITIPIVTDTPSQFYRALWQP